MNHWVMILSMVDVAFMAGILLMLFSYKKSRRPAGADLSVAGGLNSSLYEFDPEILERLKEELSAAREITERLDKKRNELEKLEESLMSNKKVIDRALKRVSVEPHVQQRRWHDTYEGATDMLNHGADVSEVVKRFDLLSGEAELITSLNRLRN